MLTIANIFKHGPQKTTNENSTNKDMLKLYNVLSLWYPPEETSCVDLSEGMSLDFSELCLSLIDQDPNVKLKYENSYCKFVNKRVFDVLEDNYSLRMEVHKYMKNVNWRVPLDIDCIYIHKDCFGKINYRIVFNQQFGPLFTSIPGIYEWLFGHFDAIFHLGDSNNDETTYYPQGNVYLVPTLLIISRW